MFEGLRARLQKIQGRLEENIAKTASPAESAPENKALSGTGPEEKDPSLLSRVKVLITDREFFIAEKDVEEPLFELEMILLENDVALPVTEEIIQRVRADLTGRRRKIGESVDGIVVSALRGAILGVLGQGFDLLSYVRDHEKPVKILFTGVNGTGKTTTVAKVASYLKKNGCSVVIGAGDTFRAGALEQIEVHAGRLGIKVIQHQAGADPSAVLFDAVQHAEANRIDAVLADTAGRFHNRANLMNQLGKIRRVMKPDLIVYVDEAVAGNDAVVRAHEFEKTVGADAVVLTKADMDPKGGAAISIAHTIGKPVMFLGVGQGYDDIIPFSPDRVVDELLGVSA
ncbi:MAG: Signal recognition particle 54 kDa protein [Methanoregulaceae archaeon PtaU1.Bin059]|nr:MAG: Signal recognition particle 54 kDa protein [Methanoregulaceae archaeon PtaB.Bin152]OPY42926.1 MAG: Signal recognition particle 54 kDa protein [Methanoregulaceae archaeon PtaU1.Bin059]